MAAPSHVIQRQIFELTVPSEAAARQIHSDLSRLHGSLLAEVVDRCCSAAGKPEATHRISTLQVDLGAVDPTNLERDLVSRLMDRLPAALEQALSSSQRAGDIPRPILDSGLAPLTGEIEGGDADGAPELPDTERLVELVAVYARTGTMPWWTDVRRPPDLKEALHRLLVTAPGDLARMLREVAATRGHLERLVVAMDDELLAEVGDLVTPEAAGGLPFGELAELVQIVPSSATSTRRRRDIWVALLQVAFEAAHPSSIDLAEASVVRLANEAHVRAVVMASELLDAASSLPASPELTAVIREAERATRRHESQRPDHAAAPEQGEGFSTRPDRRSAAGLAKLNRSAADTGRVGGNTEVRRAGNGSAAPQIALPPAPATIDLSFSDSDHMYVDNSGLVILAPFLDSLFTRLGLMREAQFESPEDRHRAVGLLQYLAAGDVAPLEHSVPLNKVLCGLDVREVFDFGDPVTDREAEECTDLLVAAIEHATVFGDISTAGFQGTFLHRRGALSSEPGTWVLRVEGETYDVVLDQVPWSFDWVALPWMSAPLRVQW